MGRGSGNEECRGLLAGPRKPSGTRSSTKEAERWAREVPEEVYGPDPYEDPQGYYMSCACADYAAALKRIHPSFQFGVQFVGGAPFHVFVHDNTEAWDYNGRHTLPYEPGFVEQSVITGLEDLDGVFGTFEEAIDDAEEVIRERLEKGDPDVPVPFASDSASGGL